MSILIQMFLPSYLNCFLHPISRGKIRLVSSPLYVYPIVNLGKMHIFRTFYPSPKFGFSTLQIWIYWCSNLRLLRLHGNSIKFKIYCCFKSFMRENTMPWNSWKREQIRISFEKVRTLGKWEIFSFSVYICGKC